LKNAVESDIFRPVGNRFRDNGKRLFTDLSVQKLHYTHFAIFCSSCDI